MESGGRGRSGAGGQRAAGGQGSPLGTDPKVWESIVKWGTTKTKKLQILFLFHNLD